MPDAGMRSLQNVKALGRRGPSAYFLAKLIEPPFCCHMLDLLLTDINCKRRLSCGRTRAASER